ncbi:MAG: bifunctional hydroxymethylpyrimidine kinase/phosphomethylpyrimidine kinase [Opitutae bacterium]|nr:bifunctional hydroxymethylpyrimidine kinase/phosphomethylpyrimidine kinase [Opitutae bacterium]
MATAKNLPTTLTIAGSDSGAGAGIQADLLAIAANGAFGVSATTALTAQNPAGVSGVHAIPADFVREQISQVAKFFKINSAKTGMLFCAEIVAVVADFFEKNPDVKFVLDPVMVATSGAKLLDNDAVSALRECLIPRADLVTPNLDEAEVFLGEKFSWRRDNNVPRAIVAGDAERLADALGVPVLLKGGHGAGETVVDALAFPQQCRKNNALSGGDNRAATTRIFESPRQRDINTHGSGCTLSAAIAANLAFCGDKPVSRDLLSQCVCRACDYVRRTMANPIRVAGENFIAHLW